MSKQNEQPKVSIIIPNKNHRDLLEPCIESIFKLTTYTDFEIIIIENGSTDKDISEYYNKLRENPKIRILDYPFEEFNYQKAINFGVENAEGEYVLQLNNDTVLLTPNWLELMIEVAERESVGAVGAKLYYPDMSIQHFGGILFMHCDDNLMCEHIYRHSPANVRDETVDLTQINETAFVTGACLMMKRSIYKQVDGMDEKYRLALGDVDLCMKVRELKLKIMVHPQVELIHNEGSTRGTELTQEELQERKYFTDKWKKILWVDLNSVSLFRATQLTACETNTQSWLIGNLYLQLDDMIKQRNNLKDQIIEIHNSNSWKIGWKITRLFRFFIPKNN